MSPMTLLYSTEPPFALSEAWTLSASNEKNLEAFERKKLPDEDCLLY